MFGIVIKVLVATSMYDSTVDVTGSLSHIITDTERNTLRVYEENLKRLISDYHGGRPRDVFVRSPTPWGDLYKSYGWDEVRTVLEPKKAEILEFDSKRTIIATKNLRNQSGRKAYFSATFSEPLTNKVKSSWSLASRLSFNQSIGYELRLDRAGATGGSTTVRFDQPWGRSQTKAEAASTATSIGVDLEPGEAAVARLSVNSGKMKVKVTYEAHLTGDVAANYYPAFEGHHFYRFDIDDLEVDRVSVEEYLEIEFYSDVIASLKMEPMTATGQGSTSTVYVFDSRTISTTELNKPLTSNQATGHVDSVFLATVVPILLIVAILVIIAIFYFHRARLPRKVIACNNRTAKRSSISTVKGNRSFRGHNGCEDPKYEEYTDSNLYYEIAEVEESPFPSDPEKKHSELSNMASYNGNNSRGPFDTNGKVNFTKGIIEPTTTSVRLNPANEHHDPVSIITNQYEILRGKGKCTVSVP